VKDLALAYYYNMNRNWYTYIITNHKNTVLYIGITNSLERRVYEHKNKINTSSFSNKYNLYKLAWFQMFKTPNEAIEAEKKIKGWKRDKKIDLIKKDNPDFRDLIKN